MCEPGDDNRVRRQMHKHDSMREDSHECDSTGGDMGGETLRDDSW